MTLINFGGPCKNDPTARRKFDRKHPTEVLRHFKLPNLDWWAWCLHDINGKREAGIILRTGIMPVVEVSSFPGRKRLHEGS